MIKNKNLLIVYAIIIASFVALYALSGRKEKRQIVGNREHIQRLPNIKYKVIKWANYNNGNFKIINFFDPQCDACQNMAKKIVKESSEFAYTHLTMLSIGSQSETIEFIRAFELDKLSFVSIGLDTAKVFFYVFKPGSLPSYFIYNSEGILTDVIYGETSISRLLKRINE